MSAVADVLNGAADLIERDGWVQGIGRDHGGRRCARVAIFDAAAGYDEARKLANWALYSEVGDVVTTWNDQLQRTQAEVVAALRAAAERAS